MQIQIKDKCFDMKEVARLYPAAMVKTGEGDEVTQISLEWIDTLANDEVEIARYAIFVHLTDNSVSSFFYETRDALDIALEDLAIQLG
ncbi:MAG: phosphomannomutase [Sulfurospirillum sp.]|nr:MAG: phosphomannomutase [Sulfurospirillum sp.]